MKKILLSVFAVVAGFTIANAQVNLVNKLNENAADTQNFRFVNLIDLSCTPVENQGASGTCWSYSTNSFLESEMIRKGKKPVHLSKIFTARNEYMEKANRFVLLQGGLSWGDGGEPHDVVNLSAKYGMMPEDAYSGLINGNTINHFDPMQTELKAILDSIIKVPAPIDPAAWKAQFAQVLDKYLGAVPATFVYEGKTYTPQTFAKEVVGFDTNDYIEFISQTTAPYYQKALMEIPDDWAFQWDFNIKPTDFIDIIDNALKSGYTVAWAADVSEPYFSWPNGVAFVPKNAQELESKKLTKEEKHALFNGDRTEMEITPEIRQAAIENLTTTDDHGMHIVGLAKDQDGKEFYIVKNSWGDKSGYKGFLYVSKNYVLYKTTGIMVNKNTVPKELRKKMGI